MESLSSASVFAKMKPSRRATVVFIAKNAFGGADAFAPVAVQLKREYGSDVTIMVLFLDRRARREVSSSTFHEMLFADLAEVVDLSIKRFQNRFLNRFWKSWRLVALLAGQRLCGRKVSILYSIQIRDWRERALVMFLGLFGRHFWLPAIQVPWNKKVADRQRPEIVNRLIEADTGRPAGRIERERLRHAICYTRQDAEMITYGTGWKPLFAPIGVPRLYPSWRDAIAKYGEPTLARELVSLGLDPNTKEFATVVLTNPGYMWYDDERVFGDLLSEILVELDRVFHGLPVLLKAKPVLEHAYAKYLSGKINLQIVKLTTVGLGALTLRSKIAFTTNESSGFFDFAAAGVPIIERSIYNKKWRDITGGGSAWEGTPGLMTAHNREELRAAIESVAAGTFSIASRENLADFFGHRKDFGVFVD